MDKYRETVATFDKMALTYRDKFAGNDCYDSAHNRFASLLKQYQACAGRRLRLLDIGCGPGHVSGMLAKRVPELEIVGIDAAPAWWHLPVNCYPRDVFIGWIAASLVVFRRCLKLMPCRLSPPSMCLKVQQRP